MLEVIVWRLTWLPGGQFKDHPQEIWMGLNNNGCLRDFQDEAKKKGHPWTLAKVGFPVSRQLNWKGEDLKWNIIRCLTPACQWAHSSPWMPCQTRTMCHCGARWRNEIGSFGIGWSLQVNGELRQEGNTKDMIFTLPRLISYISTYFTLSMCEIYLILHFKMNYLQMREIWSLRGHHLGSVQS